jgi:outer membrane protein TolC
MSKTGLARIQFNIQVLMASLSLLVWAGCSSEKYKQQADDVVYDRLDDRWKEAYGPQANYHISDVKPSEMDIGLVDPNNLPKTLTLAEAVALATTQNRRYQSEKERLYLQALDQTLAEHEFAPLFFGLLGVDYASNKGDDELHADSDFGFDLLFADGGRITVNLASEWMRFLTGSPDTSLGSTLGVTLVQPLLRGSGRTVVQENLTQAQRDTIYQLRSFGRFRKEFVVDIIDEYYEVLKSLDEIKNAENNYQNLQLAQKRVEMYANSGRRPRFEVGQAQQDTLRARDNLVRVQQQHKRLLDQFKITLALPTQTELLLDPDELKHLNNMDISDNEMPVDAAINAALQMRLDLMTAMDRIDDAERKVVVAEDGLGAELNLIGSADFDSQNAGKIGDADLRFNSHRARYGVGLEADLPFDRLVERNAYREALIALNQQNRQYQQAKDTVVLEVRQALRDLREVVIRFQIAEKSLEVAQDRVKNNDLLLQAGRAQTRDLLEAQESLLDAQNNRTTAVIAYTVTKLRLYRDIGILQVKPNGMWQENQL